MRKGEKAAIEVDRQLYKAKYIGKGQYSRVYQVGDRVVYYTREDCAKEVIARYQYDRMMHLPEIIEHDPIEIGRTRWYVYSSPFYRDVSPSDTSAHTLMKKMIKFWNKHYTDHGRRVWVGGTRWGWSGVKGAELMRRFVVDMEKSGEFPKSVILAMNEIADVSSNCGDQVGFDIHKKNFGVNEYGVLIFRDLVNPLYSP